MALISYRVIVGESEVWQKDSVWLVNDGSRILGPDHIQRPIMLLTTLPLDLIHNLFLMLDDRRTLAAFLSTSRHLHQVFKSHPNSILRQVVCNEIGMDIRVLPYAWANIKSQYIVMPEELMDTQLEITSQDSYILSLTPYTFQQLRGGHAIVQEFTKHYSIRFKEGRILQDTLTSEESRRFQIAAYLFLHYQTIWGNFQEYVSNFSDEGQEVAGIEAPEDPVQDAKTMDACRAFLSRLPTEELLWIQEFRDFLLQDMEYRLDIKNDPTYFTELGFHPRHNVNSIGAISRILHYRGVRTQADDEKILKSKGILIPACQKCGRQPEIRGFFNKTNLEELPPYWSLCVFPGQLSQNPVENTRAWKRIYLPGAPHPAGVQRKPFVIIREVMEHAETQATSSLENRGASGNDGLVVSDDAKAEIPPAKGGYKWSPDDVLCSPCFCTIFKDLYYAWWLDERQTDRVEAHTFAESPCLLGEDCYEQLKEDHATRRDHCCPRTKDVVL